MQRENEVQHVFLVGAKSLGAYGLDSRINMTRLVPQLRVLHKSQPA